MKTALIIVDVQNDFCPGGALPVPHGDEVVAPLNRWIEKFGRKGRVIVATRDWHPTDTVHFTNWPAHCVQGTEGARFHSGLNIWDLEMACNVLIVSKGKRNNEDAYSGFDGVMDDNTTMLEILEAFRIKKVYIGGLATDYCVKATALDAKRHGFNTYLILEACRAVNVKPDDGDKAVEEMKAAGVQVVSTEAL